MCDPLCRGCLLSIFTPLIIKDCEKCKSILRMDVKTNMIEYVDKDDIVDVTPKPKESRNYPTHNLDDVFELGFETAIDAVLNLKSDNHIKKVIFCSECQTCEYDKKFQEWWCNGKEVEPNHFCGDAVKREDNT